ncbi:hypothetical protein X949_5965 [Burkholderia pseudomallei MSHR5609]|nr:hypothetical protein X945_6031 [Burkholderia pseudomallei ABCPW 107]KGS53050.1 hypothetical protein X949_5965 [Burkholderia pseudomallei MSHR5609]
MVSLSHIVVLTMNKDKARRKFAALPFIDISTHAGCQAVNETDQLRISGQEQSPEFIRPVLRPSSEVSYKYC